MSSTEQDSTNIPAERNYSASVLRRLANAVRNNGGSPLSAQRRRAILDRLQGKPVFLLGSTTVYAQMFLAAAKITCDLRAVVDDLSTCTHIEEIPRISSADFLRTGAGSVSVCLAFSRNGRAYFEDLADTAGSELLHYMQVADSIPGYRHDHILQGLSAETAAQIDELISLARHFEDAMSVQTLFCILMARLTYERQYLESVNMGPESMYFGVDVLRLANNETVVDCGAFDGDTIEQVRRATSDRFKSIVALEPDLNNFRTLQEKYGNDSRVRLFPLGASDRCGKLTFSSGLGSFSHATEKAEGAETSINVTSLDALLEEPPSTIKIDIEGAELDALRGGEQTIRRHHPKLTIAAYHRPSHARELVELLRNTADNYKFYLRHHGDFFLETVLYAVPSK